MKFFLIAALAIAAVVADSDSDSDSYLLNPYSNLGYSNIYGYRNAYTAPLAGYTGYTGLTGYSGLYNPYGVRHVLGKREADSDSDSDSYLINPYTNLGYSNIYSYRNAYTAPLAARTVVPGYTGYATGLTGYSGLYNNFGVRHVLGKREADSDSDSYLLNPYSTLGYSNIYGYRNAYTAPLAARTVVPGYTGYATGLTGYSGLYNNFGVRHVIGKREAEADPELVYKNPVTGFHTNLRNVNKVAAAQAQAPVVPQVYNSVRVPSVYTQGYSPYVNNFAYARPLSYSIWG